MTPLTIPKRPGTSQQKGKGDGMEAEPRAAGAGREAGMLLREGSGHGNPEDPATGRMGSVPWG